MIVHAVFNICFSKLCEGDSGSIVYYVDWDGELYPWGMLVGSEVDPSINSHVYHAAILSEMFKDIKAAYKSQGVGKLQLFTVEK